jgi:dTMP kinase
MHTLKKGILIAIEGIDGSGKSSLAQNLYTRLQQEAYPAVLTKEPGATALGKQLRTLVQEKKVPICPQAEYLLFATDRAQHFHECIIPWLAQKKLIISDRMADSSLVYQGYGRGLDKEMITTINAWAMNNIKPDITIFVCVDATVAAQRIAQRNAALTSFEKEKNEFIQKLVHGFDQLYKNRNDVIMIDGALPMDTVTHTAYTALITWIQQHLL